MRRSAISPTRRRILLLVGLSVFGCRHAPPGADPLPRRDRTEFTVLCWNLDDYRWMDRSGNGQADDPKPPDQRRAIADLLHRVHPDVAALQELGSATLLEELRADLARAGSAYPYAVFLPAPDSDQQIALLSLHPLAPSTTHTNTYRIGAREYPVQRGFLEARLDLEPGAPLRVLVAHLRSRDYHPDGQTEMRRNEARLLGGLIRRIRRDAPDECLLIAGTLNDTPDSAPLREIFGTEEAPLTDLRPADALGDAWTWHDEADDVWRRCDYLIASPALARRVVAEKTRALRDPAASIGSRHRPLLVTFRLPSPGRSVCPPGPSGPAPQP